MCTFSVLGVFVRIRIGSHVVTITGSGNQPGSAGMRGITRRASRVVVPPGPNLVHVDASTLQHMSDFKHKTSVSSSNSKKSVISTGVSRPAWRVGRVRGFIYHSISFDKFDISDFLRFLGSPAERRGRVGQSIVPAGLRGTRPAEIGRVIGRTRRCRPMRFSTCRVAPGAKTRVSAVAARLLRACSNGGGEG